MPPNGHCGVAGTGSLMPMMPASSPSAILHADRQVVGEDVGRQAVRACCSPPRSRRRACVKSRIGITGANGSSVIIFASGDSPVSTVGSKK